jgi:hypothetical protein
MADVDLPEGTVPAYVAPGGGSLDEEDWIYNASYDGTVAFLQNQFATGRKYDTHGATWWRDLPPCYNSRVDYSTGRARPAHESPPQGWVHDDSTEWLWADGSMELDVEAFQPGNRITNGQPEIIIFYLPTDQGIGQECNHR